MGDERIFGYHRTSTDEQNLDRGVFAIEEYCKKNDLYLYRIYTDQKTGKNFDRPQYQRMKETVRKGDLILVAELDRLGRNRRDVVSEMKWFQENGVRLKFLDLPIEMPEATDSDELSANIELINDIAINLYAGMAEQELKRNKKRQREGIERAKAAGVRFGQEALMTQDEFNRRYSKLITDMIAEAAITSKKRNPKDLLPSKERAKRLGMSRATFYRYKKEYDIKEFPTYYRQYKDGFITYDDCKMRLGLTDEGFKNLELELNFVKTIKIYESEEQSIAAPQINQANLELTDVTFDDDNTTKAYIDNLRIKIKMAKPIYQDDQENLKVYRQWYEYLPTLYGNPLTDVKIELARLEIAVDHMLTLISNASEL